VEGTKITINVPPGNQGSLGMNKNDTITVDTSNILFIFMGAFTGLEKIIFEKISKVDRVSIYQTLSW
jgi:ATP-dependent protease Clp ATPase subunit